MNFQGKKKMIGLVALILIFSLAAAGCGADASEEDLQEENEAAMVEQEEQSEQDHTDDEEIDRSDWPDNIRFAVDGIDGMEELQRRYTVFQELISDLMGVEFELFPLADRTVVVTAMEFDQIDVGLIGPAEYVQMKGAVPGIEISAALQRDMYSAAFIVREDSEIQTLDDLKGKRLSMKEQASGSGHIAPSSILIEHGFDLDQDFEEILFLGGTAPEAVQAGDVDAMADGIRVYHRLVEEDGDGVWRLLHEGPPLPQDPFVTSPNLPESFKAEFSRVLMDHQDEILEAILESEENVKYNNAEIVMVDDSDFDLMRETYRTLGITLD